MRCYCGNDMMLVFYVPKESNYTFFWGCTDYPNCKKTTEYAPMSPKLDIASQDTMDALKILEEGDVEEKATVINEIKVQMIDILNHFIDCTWCAHYMTLFNKMIVPYLDDPKVLQYVLKGPIINDNKGNVYSGKTGTKMYDELYFYLKRVESKSVQEFLSFEFKKLK